MRSVQSATVMIASMLAGVPLGHAAAATTTCLSGQPAGDRVAFVRSGELWIMNGDGSSPRQVTAAGVSLNRPTWSPDGSRVAAESRRPDNFDIVVVDVATGTVRNITNTTDRDEGSPSWSPAGDRIAYHAAGSQLIAGTDSLRSSDYEIWSIKPDGIGAAIVSARPPQTGEVGDRAPPT